MKNDQDLFRELGRTTVSKVRIGNGEYIPMKGKGTIAIESQTGIALSRMLKTKRRLGHFHHDAVLYMKKNQIAEGLPDLEKDLPICATCQYGKQTKLPFPKKTSWRATQKLQLVHIDVGGPQKTPSLKGRNNVVLVNKFKAEMKQVLEMTDLREMTYFLGIEVHQQQHDIFIYGAEKADEGLFRSMIRCLMSLTAKRLDIMYAISLLSSQVKIFILHGYSDSDWVGCVDDMRSTSGYCFSFGYGIFSWSSKKQEIVAQSTIEAEYVAATVAVNQVLWLRKLLTDLDMK
ncbi:putative mitochondrial protein [Vitis vinifera]|uniref:Putative mitochondrial protein n=1 Tax=Vitis vinifera TaxID=29760 RepID=A0A438CHI1_VITVI|nr:putative mitochondrial protein [Vitis vinifera]